MASDNAVRQYSLPEGQTSAGGQTNTEVDHLDQTTEARAFLEQLATGKARIPGEFGPVKYTIPPRSWWTDLGDRSWIE